MILGALNGVGGQDYLEQQAIANPVAFLSLLSRVIPQQLAVNIKREIVELGDDELLAIANRGKKVYEAAEGEWTRLHPEEPIGTAD